MCSLENKYDAAHSPGNTVKNNVYDYSGYFPLQVFSALMKDGLKEADKTGSPALRS